VRQCFLMNLSSTKFHENPFNDSRAAKFRQTEIETVKLIAKFMQLFIANPKKNCDGQTHSSFRRSPNMNLSCRFVSMRSVIENLEIIKRISFLLSTASSVKFQVVCVRRK
jgi:hypothetical protein